MLIDIANSNAIFGLYGKIPDIYKRYQTKIQYEKIKSPRNAIYKYNVYF